MQAHSPIIPPNYPQSEIHPFKHFCLDIKSTPDFAGRAFYIQYTLLSSEAGQFVFDGLEQLNPAG
jgi:hypothetical protein